MTKKNLFSEPMTEKETALLHTQIATYKAEEKAKLLLEMLVDARGAVRLAAAKEHTAENELEKEKETEKEKQ